MMENPFESWTYKRMARFFLAMFIVLFCAAYIGDKPIIEGVKAEIVVNNTYEFGGAGTETYAVTNGAAGCCIGGNFIADLYSVVADFTTIKTYNLFTFTNVIAPGTLTLAGAMTGINENYTTFTATVDGNYYGTGVIGWQRTTGDNFNYRIIFSDVDSSYTQTISGLKTIVFTYDTDVYGTGNFVGSWGTANGYPVASYTNVYANAVYWDTINTRYEYSPTIGPGQHYEYSFQDYVTLTFDTFSSSFGTLNLSKYGFNVGLNITNLSTYSFYNVTNVYDVSKFVNISGGLIARIYSVNADTWLIIQIFDTNGVLNNSVIPYVYSYTQNINGSGAVQYERANVQFDYDTYFNNSNFRLTYDVKLLSNNTDFDTEIKPFLSYYINVVDSSNIVINRKDIDLTCSNQRPIWDILNWYREWSCSVTYPPISAYFIEVPTANWTNGTYTANLYEKYFDTNTLIYTDTTNILNITGFQGTTTSSTASATTSYDMGTGFKDLIHQWFGNSSATDFIISLIIIIIVAFLVFKYTKTPMFAAGSTVLSTGACVTIGILPMIWGIMFVVLTAVTFARMMRSEL